MELGKLIHKQKYTYTAGIDWGKCVFAPTGFYWEDGYDITLFNKFKFKIITKKWGVKPDKHWNKK